MLDLRVYSPEMELIGFVSGITSLQWHRRLNTPGEFELHVAPTTDNVSYLQLENLVWLQGKPESGVIESVEIKRDAGAEMTVKGRFLSSYMDRRLIRPFYSIDNGLVETAMRAIYSMAAEIPRVSLGSEIGITDKVSFQATYKNLLEYEEKLAQYADIGFRFRPDFDAKTIVFELYTGTDRTTSQTGRSHVIFSPEYGNLESFEYTRSTDTYKTVCYVGGQGEGDARTWVTTGDDSTTGLDRREAELDATDITKEDGMTDAQYQAALEQRGEDKLIKEYRMSLTYEASIAPVGNFSYPDDYDLGDKVTVRLPVYGIETDERITEINEVYESGTYKIEPTFGTRASISFSDK